MILGERDDKQLSLLHTKNLCIILLMVGGWMMMDEGDIILSLCIKESQLKYNII